MIINNAKAKISAVKSLCSQYWCRFDQERYSRYENNSAEDFWRLYIADEKKQVNLEEIVVNYHKLYQVYATHYNNLYKGTQNFLSWCTEAGYNIYLISHETASSIEQSVASFWLEPYIQDYLSFGEETPEWTKAKNDIINKLDSKETLRIEKFSSFIKDALDKGKNIAQITHSEVEKTTLKASIVVDTWFEMIEKIS